MEDALSIVIAAARGQSRLHAPPGNSPASFQALSEAEFAIAHEVPGQCGGDLWFGHPQSNAVGAISPLPRAKVLSASRFQGKKRTSSSIADCAPETVGKVTSRKTSEASRAWHVCAAACQRYQSHYPFELRLPERMGNCERTTFPEAAMTEQNWPCTFEQAVLPHLDAAYNLARWLTRNEQDAQDAVQEAYLRAFRHFPDFRGGNARAWLLKIVRNSCYSWLRVNRPLQDAKEFDENLFVPDFRSLNPEEVLLQNNSGTVVREALQKLPTNFREVIILRELEGLSYREIADITGMPAGTVMSSLSRARDRLRQVLTSSMNEGSVPSSRQTAVVNT
jgi:RNA polymerase sigma factor (sigma-70 family)